MRGRGGAEGPPPQLKALRDSTATATIDANDVEEEKGVVEGEGDTRHSGELGGVEPADPVRQDATEKPRPAFAPPPRPPRENNSIYCCIHAHTDGSINRLRLRELGREGRKKRAPKNPVRKKKKVPRRRKAGGKVLCPQKPALTHRRPRPPWPRSRSGSSRTSRPAVRCVGLFLPGLPQSIRSPAMLDMFRHLISVIYFSALKTIFR